MDIDQNIVKSEPRAKTTDHLSNGQIIDQKDPFLPEKQPNFRSPSPDDDKNDLEEYSCYYCTDYKTDNKDHYERHVIL